MTDSQLDRLRLMESDLLHLQREATALAVRAYELHELACEMLNSELGRPLSADTSSSA
jgi:hypothetical protein